MAKAIVKTPSPTGTNNKYRTDQEPTKAQSLPLASAIPDQADMDEAKELIVEGLALTQAVKEMDGKLADVKLRLKELAEKHKLTDGMRYANAAVVITYSSRNSLDKALLVENGVTAAQIEASQRPSLVTTIKCVEVQR